MKKILIIKLILSFLLINMLFASNVESEQNRAKITFLEFGSKGCIPCRKMEPILEKISEKYPKQVDVKFYNIRKPNGRKKAMKYEVRVIPTQVFIDSSGKEIFRHEGFYPLDKIEALLKDNNITPSTLDKNKNEIEKAK